jgi:pimeloyl-ACP methyl ester carboxylesterase
VPIEHVNGVDLHTQALGKDGSRIVLLHGMFLGSLATWYFTTGAVLARAHRVFMYDLRGHGRSTRPESGYGVRQQAADLAVLVERFAGGEPVTLVGHSFGAVIALRYALDHPGAVARLVLVEAPLPVATAPWLEGLRDDLRRGLVDTLTPWRRMKLWFGGRDALPALLRDGADGPAKEKMLGMLPGVQRDAFATGGRRAQRLFAQMSGLVLKTSSLRDMLAEPDIPDAELARFDGRVLLVYGTRTMPALKDTCRRLAEVLPQASVVWLEGSHELPWETPGPLARAIAGFLDG